MSDALRGGRESSITPFFIFSLEGATELKFVYLHELWEVVTEVIVGESSQPADGLGANTLLRETAEHSNHY